MAFLSLPRSGWVLATLAAWSVVGLAADRSTSEKTPPELGFVRWQRDHAAALAKAKEANKPVLALFQEVPG